MNQIPREERHKNYIRLEINLVFFFVFFLVFSSLPCLKRLEFSDMLNLLKINETLFEEEVSLAESIIASYSAEFSFIRPIRYVRR